MQVTTTCGRLLQRLVGQPVSERVSWLSLARSCRRSWWVLSAAIRCELRSEGSRAWGCELEKAAPEACSLWESSQSATTAARAVLRSRGPLEMAVSSRDQWRTTKRGQLSSRRRMRPDLTQSGRTAHRTRASKPDLVELNRLPMTCRSRSRTAEIRSTLESAQRTAVKQRPHQETRRHPVATSEPVVLTTGEREAAMVATRRGRLLQRLVGRRSVSTKST